MTKEKCKMCEDFSFCATHKQMMNHISELHEDNEKLRDIVFDATREIDELKKKIVEFEKQNYDEFQVNLKLCEKIKKLEKMVNDEHCGREDIKKELKKVK